MRSTNVLFKVIADNQVIMGRASAWDYSPTDFSQDGVGLEINTPLDNNLANNLKRDFTFKTFVLFADRNKEIPVYNVDEKSYCYKKI